jgi:hypothetical protein
MQPQNRAPADFVLGVICPFGTPALPSVFWQDYLSGDQWLSVGKAKVFSSLPRRKASTCTAITRRSGAGAFSFIMTLFVMMMFVLCRLALSVDVAKWRKQTEGRESHDSFAVVPLYVSCKVGERGPGEEGVYWGRPKAEWTKEAPRVQNML